MKARTPEQHARAWWRKRFRGRHHAGAPLPALPALPALLAAWRASLPARYR